MKPADIFASVLKVIFRTLAASNWVRGAILQSSVPQKCTQPANVCQLSVDGALHHCCLCFSLKFQFASCSSLSSRIRSGKIRAICLICQLFGVRWWSHFADVVLCFLCSPGLLFMQTLPLFYSLTLIPPSLLL